MGLRTSVPQEHVGASAPVQFTPPVAVVGYVPWSNVINALVNTANLRTEIIANGIFFPIGHLEVGATLSVSPKDVALPGAFEGETQHSHQSVYFMGLELSLECKINLFHKIPDEVLRPGNANASFPFQVGYVGNRGGMYTYGEGDSVPHPSVAGIVAYWTYMLGRNPIVKSGLMPLFGVVNTHKKFHEYFIILNARMSSPGRAFPIGGSPTTMVVEVYTTGIGLVNSNFPKIGDEAIGIPQATEHIIKEIENRSNQRFYNYLAAGFTSSAFVYPGITPTFKIRRNDGEVGQTVVGGRMLITPLAIWGGGTNEGENALGLFTNYINIVMA